jgi:transcriptional regulator with XRE-family HTH domain
MSVIREARVEQGLTQAQLARRLGITQPAVARMERAGDNIGVSTVRRAFAALGYELDLRFVARAPSHDETLLLENLKLTPAERLAAFERFYAGAQSLRAAGERARGTS